MDFAFSEQQLIRKMSKTTLLNGADSHEHWVMRATYQLIIHVNSDKCLLVNTSTGPELMAGLIHL